MNKIKDSRIRGDGVELAVRDWGGSGVPILFLPGAGQNLVDFTPMAELLVSRHRVVGMDWRGHGHSQDGPWTLEHVLADIHRVITHFGFQQVVLVGHSLGGLLATLCGARYAECAAVINMDGQSNALREDSGYLYGDLDPDYVKAKQAEVRLLEAAQLSAAQAPPMEREQFEAFIAALTMQLAPAGIAPSMIRESAERSVVTAADGRIVRRPTPATTGELMSVVNGINLLAENRHCRSPLLIIHAAKEVPLPEGLPVSGMNELMRSYRRGLRKALAQMERDFSLARVVDVDATHGMPIEIPAVLAGHIESFLASHGIV